MNLKTLEALEASIEHWKRLVSGNIKDGEAPCAVDCELCQTFFNNDPRCEGCPVYERIKLPQCRNTPYIQARDAWLEYGLYSPQFQEAAQKELDFLKSLLPK